MKATTLKFGHVVDYTPGSNVAAGDVVVQGELIGIATEPIPANALGALAVTGVFRVVKSSESISAGAKVYWHAGNQWLTPTSTGAVYFGKAVAAAGGSATHCVALLCP